MKYIAVIIIAFVVWLTSPFWMVNHSTGPSETKIDKFIEKKSEESAKMTAQEEEALRKYVEKFGEKPKIRYSTGTPILVQNYWKKHFKHPEAVIELRCTPLKQTDKGWMTVCDYRAKEDSAGLSIYQDVYYINNGIVSK
ncbi:hypothetical protein YH65_05500 [Sulfurovum lithotrophicum]|uniref:Uncharacterized protein n=1 Tax=Sulfurovum lithotrophicum TaxID=206403 RepID=A0A7U4M137_9BACT|nr:hypothetical protein [Sulfurovum lithotrophicum]AKF24905.1 hypothetical protein YH65_05500 [Sulfurovum lithotrophicum]